MMGSPRASRAAWAAYNNAVWCDMLCRAHGVPGEFYPALWLNRRQTPPFYPNMVTLVAEQGEGQVAAVEILREVSIPGVWAVKDSFATLELAASGFHILFEAQWLWLLPSQPLLAPGRETTTWHAIRHPAELAAWEAAWSEGAEGKAGRLFPDALLLEEDVIFLAATREGQLQAGAIANRNAEVVGLSNFFALAEDTAAFWVGCLAAIRERFPGLPVVGYETGAQLAQLRAVGFEAVGPLRVWEFRR